MASGQGEEEHFQQMEEDQLEEDIVQQIHSAQDVSQIANNVRARC